MRHGLNTMLAVPGHDARTPVFELSWRGLCLACGVALLMMVCPAHADGNNLLPKYGPSPKSEMQKTADQKFLAEMDGHYKGDRQRAGQDAALRGWQLLRQGNQAEAMKRFNQAWLLDTRNGTALWGMGVLSAMAGRMDESVALFAEAEPYLDQDIDFMADHARALGMAGTQTRNSGMLRDAMARFARVYERAPQHTLNLQNWAIALFYSGDYAQAWKKIELAEATPRRDSLDRNFIAALQAKMPRP